MLSQNLLSKTRIICRNLVQSTITANNSLAIAEAEGGLFANHHQNKYALPHRNVLADGRLVQLDRVNSDVDMVQVHELVNETIRSGNWLRHSSQFDSERFQSYFLKQQLTDVLLLRSTETPSKILAAARIDFKGLATHGHKIMQADIFVAEEARHLNAERLIDQALKGASAQGVAKSESEIVSALTLNNGTAFVFKYSHLYF